MTGSTVRGKIPVETLPKMWPQGDQSCCVVTSHLKRQATSPEGQILKSTARLHCLSTDVHEQHELCMRLCGPSCCIGCLQRVFGCLASSHWTWLCLCCRRLPKRVGCTTESGLLHACSIYCLWRSCHNIETAEPYSGQLMTCYKTDI